MTPSTVTLLVIDLAGHIVFLLLGVMIGAWLYHAGRTGRSPLPPIASIFKRAPAAEHNGKPADDESAPPKVARF